MNNRLLTTSQTLWRMAVELNDMAVQLHITHNLDQAGEFYRDAYNAMTDAVRITRDSNAAESSGHSAEQEESQYQVQSPNANETRRSSSRWASNTTGPQATTSASDLLSFNSSPDEIVATLMRPVPIAIPAVYAGEESIVAPTILHNLGLLHCDRGSTRSAVSIMTSASSLMRSARSQQRLVYGLTWISVHYTLGAISCQRNNHKDAVLWLTISTQATRTIDEGSRVVCARLLNNAGHILFKVGQAHNALMAFQCASSIDSHHNLGVALSEAKTVESAAAAA